ncbi:MAG: hypothetical protein ACYC27_15920 [Armatimonadota bacterium]
MTIKATKRILISAVIISIITFIAILLAIPFYVMFWPLHKPERVFLSNCSDGVTFHGNNGHGATYEIKSKNGEILEFAPFAVTDSAFAYWSWRDDAVAWVSDSHKEIIWFSIPGNIGVDMSTCNALRLSTDGHFVAVEMDGPDEKQTVFLLNIEDDVWKVVPDAQQARIDPSGSGRILVCTDQNELVMRNLTVPGKDVSFTSLAPDTVDWDFDFNSQMLFYLDYSSSGQSRVVRILKSGKRTTRSLPLFWDGLDLYWQPGYQELWVAGHSLLSIQKHPIYSAKSRFLGNLPTSSFYFIEADSKIEYLLSKHFVSK